MTEVSIRPARPGDGEVVFGFVRQLAVYEHLEHELRATPASFEAALFGPAPRAFCDFVEEDGVPVGLALGFYSFSTFEGRHGIWLEDLFVDPAKRGRGYGKALLVHLAKRCVAEGLARFEWSVLDWNAPSIAFYRGLGARPKDEWTIMRVDGAALDRLAGGEEGTA
ncbi:MAG: GNAT family N-acetyltransferase [Phyllobacteriaceae bacterium]|nr:GNAT family N-acetyltransferase [Phyllobacteriaceae bacterium]